jgi:putative component of membrane protein insertase Oxa1/YidC/SpoIIIJ protein YidD
MKLSSILFFLTIISNLSAQTDWIKWEKSNASYAKKGEATVRDYSISGDNITDFMTESFILAYRFFISDLDGDNCPFRPSCSTFFVESVKETNLPQGILMFFDRFTRDLNIFNRVDKYPRVGTSHFYDPLKRYTLSEEKLDYLPPYTFITSE